MNNFVRLVFLIVLVAGPARADDRFLDIKTVTSEGGITAWLVEDHTLPVISMRFAFDGSGAALEDPARQGLVQLLSNTMDEGAGELDSTAFQKTLLDQSITLRFSGGRDAFGGTLKTLTAHKDKAFELLQLALAAPRFDPGPVERMKQANLARIRNALSDPEWMAARLINDRAFEGHPYAMNAGGTLSTLARLTPADLREFYETYLTRDRLIVAVVGDITPGELAKRLDALFAPLPAQGPERAKTPLSIQNTQTITLYEHAIPQTVIEIMLPAFGHQDQDYFALQVLNYIFGGAGFGSRLMEEVREKRGLSYGIYSSLRHYDETDAMAISLSTKNDSAAQALAVIRHEMTRLINEPVSDKELQDAKSYLTGSMPLALSSTDSIAGMLLSMQEEDLPIDYLDHYADRIDAVTPADIQRVAVRLFSRYPMTIALVGQPEGLEPSLIVETLPNAQ